jgi:hypothetical protein
MDDFAVRAEDTEVAPARLQVVGTVMAGQVTVIAIGPGEAVRIMTGALLLSLFINPSPAAQTSATKVKMLSLATISSRGVPGLPQHTLVSYQARSQIGSRLPPTPDWCPLDQDELVRRD